MKMYKRILIFFLTALSLSTTNTNCIDFGPLRESIDEANQTIKEGLKMVVTDSDNWKAIITDSILPFIDTRLFWVTEDLNRLVEKTAQEAQAQAACFSDQAGSRVVNGLNQILSNLDGARRSALVFPLVCSASPAVLKLDIPVSHRSVIQVNGFDFMDRDAFELYLSKNGHEERIFQDRVTWTSRYLFQVDVSNYDSTLSKYDHLVVKYDGIFLTEILIQK